VHFFNKALKIDNENGAYWKAVADAEYKIGNVVSALDAYVEASEMDPENAQVWLDWSLVYYDQGEFEQAISVIESGLDEMPTHAELFYRAVVYFIATGSYKHAITKLETALMLDYEGHKMLFDFFPDLHTQKALYRIIERYGDSNE
jgi:tetratricopeptide (TPR) repeat protein